MSHSPAPAPAPAHWHAVIGSPSPRICAMPFLRWPAVCPRPRGRPTGGSDPPAVHRLPAAPRRTKARRSTIGFEVALPAGARRNRLPPGRVSPGVRRFRGRRSTRHRLFPTGSVTSPLWSRAGTKQNAFDVGATDAHAPTDAPDVDPATAPPRQGNRQRSRNGRRPTSVMVRMKGVRAHGLLP